MSNRIVIAGVVLGVLASACLVSRRVHLRRRDTQPPDLSHATRRAVEGRDELVNRDAVGWPTS
jgi:hypothetical protein